MFVCYNNLTKKIHLNVALYQYRHQAHTGCHNETMIYRCITFHANKLLLL